MSIGSDTSGPVPKERHESADLRHARPGDPSPLARRLGLGLVRAAVFSAPPPEVGRYQIEAKVGEGGIGTVFRAVDTVLGRTVAIKILSAFLERARAELLQAEARILAELAHPNIITIYDLGCSEDEPWLVLEWMDGVDLFVWIESEPKPTWRDVARVMVDAALGLAAAHIRDVIHRDFKRQNVLIDREGRVKVADFGSAVTQHSASESPGLAGTYGYLAPETRAGVPPCAASDQYSFGVALEFLFRRAPPAEEHRVRLDEIIARAKAVEPGDRWPSMASLARALDGWSTNLEIPEAGEQSDAGPHVWSCRLHTPRFAWSMCELATLASDLATYRREAVRLLDQLVGFDTILLGDPAGFDEGAPTIRDFDPAFVEQFRADPARYAPTLARVLIASIKEQGPVRDIDIWSNRARNSEPFYTELIGPKGSKVMALGALQHQGLMVGTVQISRSAMGTKFSDRELKVLATLAPYLALAESRFGRAHLQPDARDDK